MNNQKLSLSLNVVLLIAVIVLFIKVYSMPVNGTSEAGNNNSSDTTKAKILPDDGVLRIAFIKSDSINEEYEWLLDRKEELADEEAKVKGSLEAKLKAAAKREQEIQKDYHLMSLSQQQAAQMELQKLGEEYSKAEQTMLGGLQEKEMLYQKQLHENVEKYLRTYAEENKIDYVFSYVAGMQLLYANPGTDITSDVIKGLNEEYRSFKDGASTQEK